jgi:excisionase family DNA binding protein
LRKGAEGGATQAAAVPDVMTPGEAAGYLKVSEEDVVAAIKAGGIKAKKIGKGYRISKKALDDYLGE